MIKKLRIRFIAASMLALSVVLLVILGGINLMSYHKVIQDADSVLRVLADNGGRFPQHMDDAPDRKMNIRKGMPADRGLFKKPGLSLETPFESRFFIVQFNADGKVSGVDIQMIASVDQETAAQCAEQVYSSGREMGFWGDFRFLSVANAESVYILFLDCSRNLEHFRTTLLASIGISLGGLAAVLVLLMVFSGRIVKPIAESYEKQKRFITDAGHEIKTPLTVIGADLELAEMESGENEWLQDIHLQIRRLTELTNDLILLSRMDEEQPLLQTVEFSASDMVEETTQSFRNLAVSQGKTVTVSIQPMLSVEGVENHLRRLISILLDNAVKYSPSEGEIRVALEQKGKNLVFTVSNSVCETISEQQLGQLFDRFYRADPARSTSGGYGLGLSIAKGIVNAHKGTIDASSGADCLTITVTLPVKQ